MEVELRKDYLNVHHFVTELLEYQWCDVCVYEHFVFFRIFWTYNSEF